MLKILQAQLRGYILGRVNALLPSEDAVRACVLLRVLPFGSYRPRFGNGKSAEIYQKEFGTS